MMEKETKPDTPPTSKSPPPFQRKEGMAKESTAKEEIDSTVQAKNETKSQNKAEVKEDVGKPGRDLESLPPRYRYQDLKEGKEKKEEKKEEEKEKKEDTGGKESREDEKGEVGDEEGSGDKGDRGTDEAKGTNGHKVSSEAKGDKGDKGDKGEGAEKGDKTESTRRVESKTASQAGQETDKKRKREDEEQTPDEAPSKKEGENSDATTKEGTDSRTKVDNTKTVDAMTAPRPGQQSRKRRTTEPTDFRCEYAGCGLYFSTRSSLVRHNRIHTGEKPFKCLIPNCGKSFSQSTHLTIHTRTHTGERPFKCKYDGCKQTFLTQSDLTTHIRIHTREKPFTCQYPGCGKAFARKSDQRTHEYTHTHERPHQCKFQGCTRSFSKSSDLAKHHRTHTGQRPYTCGVPGCGKKFAVRSNLLTHLRRERHADFMKNDFRPESLEKYVICDFKDENGKRRIRDPDGDDTEDVSEGERSGDESGDGSEFAMRGYPVNNPMGHSMRMGMMPQGAMGMGMGMMGPNPGMHGMFFPGGPMMMGGGRDPMPQYGGNIPQHMQHAMPRQFPPHYGGPSGQQQQGWYGGSAPMANPGNTIPGMAMGDHGQMKPWDYHGNGTSLMEGQWGGRPQHPMMHMPNYGAGPPRGPPPYPGQQSYYGNPQHPGGGQ